MLWVILASALAAVVNGGPPCAQPRNPALRGKTVGGRETAIEEHPYQVSVQVYGEHYCGGSILRPDAVVTAAHCAEHYELLHAMTVRAGSADKEEGGQVVAVRRICSHPKYVPSVFDYDVSVLHLSQPLALSAQVRAISPQPAGAEVPDGTLAVVTGWGDVYSAGPESDRLQEVVVPKMNDDQCAKYYYQYTVTNRMHCFGYLKGGRDACQADSGGPLVVDGYLAGIVSWGVGCALPNNPGVYTKVSHPKIISHIDNCMTEFKRSYIRINSYDNHTVQ